MYDNIVKNKSIILLCHTALGDPTDPHGRYFEVGKEYSADIETVNIGFDTKFSPCVLLWINFNSGYGSRFTMVGNIYHHHHYENGYWDHFTKYFACPVSRDRDNIIGDILGVEISTQ